MYKRQAKSNRADQKPNLKQIKAAAGTNAVAVSHPSLGEFVLACEGEVPLLFTENETNSARLFPGPVSYTHLDVYKRQVRPCRGWRVPRG